MAYVINEPCIGTKDNSCVEVCPVDAITPEEMVPPNWQHYIERNAAYSPESAGRLRRKVRTLRVRRRRGSVPRPAGPRTKGSSSCLRPVAS
jgi:NAD-dependent dihydropyrimidine dehydrogenase PreA subunit